VPRLAGGPNAVRVDVLAQELGITRGSVYWNFQDRATFVDEMLDTWEHRCTDEAIERVEGEGPHQSG
jgi:AcrR family transcriptional regulator